MNKQEKLLREKVRRLLTEDHDSYFASFQAVRNPFSHSRSHLSKTNWDGGFQDYTQLYNITYRARHLEEGFEKVVYSEPLNMLVAIPLEEAEKLDGPYAIFGLKTAKGFDHDYRYTDMDIKGAGSLYMERDEAEELISNTRRGIEKYNPQYGMNIGLVPPSEAQLEKRDD